MSKTLFRVVLSGETHIEEFHVRKDGTLVNGEGRVSNVYRFRAEETPNRSSDFGVISKQEKGYVEEDCLEYAGSFNSTPSKRIFPLGIPPRSAGKGAPRSESGASLLTDPFEGWHEFWTGSEHLAKVVLIMFRIGYIKGRYENPKPLTSDRETRCFS